MMSGTVEGGVVMADEATAGEKSTPVLRTLADKVNWLIDRAHPAGRGPYSNAEVIALIEKVTGEQFSHTTIWKLRNGQAANPQMRLIEALARTFGVPPAFFFSDYDDEQAGLLREQVELLALVRDTGVTSAQLRALLQLSPGARQAVADLIEHTARTEAQRGRSDRD
jgi:transcriptional regulator with XRE-family HTH domain